MYEWIFLSIMNWFSQHVLFARNYSSLTEMCRIKCCVYVASDNNRRQIKSLVHKRTETRNGRGQFRNLSLRSEKTLREKASILFEIQTKYESHELSLSVSFSADSLIFSITPWTTRKGLPDTTGSRIRYFGQRQWNKWWKTLSVTQIKTESTVFWDNAVWWLVRV
jgi:hypothetical protein